MMKPKALFSPVSSSRSKEGGAHRAVFFNEVLDGRGSGWAIPIWHIVVVGAKTYEEVLENAVTEFESEWPCGAWSEIATNIEIEELSAVAEVEPLAPKRVIRTHAPVFDERLSAFQ